MIELDKLLEMGYAVALQPKTKKREGLVWVSVVGPKGIFEAVGTAELCIKELHKEIIESED